MTKCQEWRDGACGTTANLCTIPFTNGLVRALRTGGLSAAYSLIGRNSIYTSDGPLDKEDKQYCAQVTGGINYGFWYPVESY